MYLPGCIVYGFIYHKYSVDPLKSPPSGTALKGSVVRTMVRVLRYLFPSRLQLCVFMYLFNDKYAILVSIVSVHYREIK